MKNPPVSSWLAILGLIIGQVRYYVGNYVINCYKLLAYTVSYVKSSKWDVSSLKCIVLCVFLLLGALSQFLPLSASPAIDLQIIQQLESSGNSSAHNSRTQATGLYQVTPICLKDFNESGGGVLRNDGEPLTLEDMKDPFYAQAVTEWYLEKRIPSLLQARGATISLDAVLTAWNCGHACLGREKLPKETVQFIKKYKEVANG